MLDGVSAQFGWESAASNWVYGDIRGLIANKGSDAGDLNYDINAIQTFSESSTNPYSSESSWLNIKWKEVYEAVSRCNYVVSPYPSFTDVNQARLALRMERKLELGMEGHRWFDLNRWGITVEELNRALQYEKSMPWGRSLYGNAFVGPEDVTYPIPQMQIDISHKRGVRQNSLFKIYLIFKAWNRLSVKIIIVFLTHPKPCKQGFSPLYS